MQQRRRVAQTASLITAMFQVGGTLGAIVLGWLMDRSIRITCWRSPMRSAGVFVVR